MHRRPNPPRALAITLGTALTALLAATLAACGGSDSQQPTPITAAADALTLGAGQSGSLLANDRIGDAAANAAGGGNAAFTLTITNMPAGIAVSNAGVVSVFPAAVPGVVSLSYRLCEAAAPDNCANATAQLTVPAPAIVATADSLSLATGASGDLLANDTLGGAPATAALVTASATGTLPAGLALSAAGVLSVGSGATAGSYPVGYRICQTVAPGNCATATATVTVPALGTLTGRAIDAATAQGIPGVSVSAGGQSTTTDANGAFTIDGLAATSRLAVVLSAPTHAETVGITHIDAARSSDLQLRLVRVAATGSVPAAAGGTVTVPGSPAQVQLPAAGLQRADGSLPSGNVTVRLTPIDPASDSAVMPGDFTTIVSGSAVPIQSYGALNVQLADSAGTALNLRSGQTATIRIPVATRSATVPATIPLFWFDNAAGRWVQEGSATLAGSGSARYYEGTVAHFSTWNADQVMNTVRVSGCLADANGVRVAGAQVFSDGIDYSGTSSTATDANGAFTIALARDGQATLVGVSGGLLSNTLRVGPYTADATLASCLTLGQTGAGITMKLTWGALPSDLDSHLITPSGDEIYYSRQGSLVAAPFANLDVDDTTSFGPEVVTLTKLMVGTYKYFVVNYSGYADGPIAASSARVELNVPGRSAELFTPPAAGETSATDVWTLFELDVDAQCNVSVRRVPGYAAAPPAAPLVSAPVYCAR